MRLRPCGLLVVTLALAGWSRPLSGQDSTASRARQRAALAGLVDSLEAAGDWRSAIAPLDRLLELDPADPARLRQRGLFAAWTGDHERGIELLRRAAAQQPHNPDNLAALARVLSWSPATRDESARMFADALGHDSSSVELMIGYADLLSWAPRTREQARALYRRVLARSPREPRARVGLANLLAWEGEPARALRSYDSVLAGAPENLDALRGRAAMLNQLGHHSAAARTVRRALQLAPANSMLRGVADSAHRATASAVQVSGLARRRQNQLDVNRLTGRAIASAGAFKLYGEYERSSLEDAAAGFRSEAYGGGARIDHGGLTVRTAGRLRTIRGLDSQQWDGSLDLGWSIARGFSVGAGVSRSPIEESRRAVQGELDGGQLRGVVHANLAHASLLLGDLPGPFDAEATIQGGRYTGLNLEANRRVTLDTRVGLLLHGAQPWVRIGYGFAASRFDYNADLGLAQLPAQRGGYFSPAEYWSHQGIVQLSQQFGSRVRWEADGRMGPEWVRQLDGATTTSRNTAVAYTSLTIRVGSALDLAGRFLYVNAFDAFEMKEFATVVKVYFP
jgi:tetratricopeptide (TPR) repeat protein